MTGIMKDLFLKKLLNKFGDGCERVKIARLYFA